MKLGRYELGLDCDKEASIYRSVFLIKEKGWIRAGGRRLLNEKVERNKVWLTKDFTKKLCDPLPLPSPLPISSLP